MTPKYARTVGISVATAAAGDCDTTTVIFSDDACTEATGVVLETLATVGEATENSWTVDGEAYDFTITVATCDEGENGMTWSATGVNPETDEEETEEDGTTLDECVGPDDEAGSYMITTKGLLSSESAPSGGSDGDDDDEEEEDSATKVY